MWGAPRARERHRSADGRLPSHKVVFFTQKQQKSVPGSDDADAFHASQPLAPRIEDAGMVVGVSFPPPKVLPEKCEAVFPQEASENKELGSFRDSFEVGTTLVDLGFRYRLAETRLQEIEIAAVVGLPNVL